MGHTSIIGNHSRDVVVSSLEKGQMWNLKDTFSSQHLLNFLLNPTFSTLLHLAFMIDTYRHVEGELQETERGMWQMDGKETALMWHKEKIVIAYLAMHPASLLCYQCNPKWFCCILDIISMLL